MREAYNLFNEISDKLFGPEEALKGDGEDAEKEEDEDEDEEDIDAAFDKEKTELAEMRKKTVSGERRFQVRLEKFNANSWKCFIHSNIQSNREKSQRDEIMPLNPMSIKVVESGARNCIFIKTTLEEPHRLVTELIDRFFRLKSIHEQILKRKGIHF